MAKITSSAPQRGAAGKISLKAAQRIAIAAMLIALILLMVGNVFYQSEREQFAAGWRSARVVEIGEGKSIKVEKATDCRNEQRYENLSSQRFLLALYRAGPNRFRNRVVPLADMQNLAIGQEVLINTARCDNAVRILPSAN